MLRVIRRTVSPIAAAVLLSLFATAALAESPEAAVQRYLALAFEGRFEELPKSAGADTRDFEQKLRNVLRVRCITTEHLSIARADRGGVASLDAETLIWKSDREEPAATFRELIRLRFELVRDGDRWLVASVVNTEVELAQRLVTANDEARARLLAERPDGVSRGVARAIYDRAMALLNSGKFADAARVLALAKQVAVDAGDQGVEALALGAMVYTTKDPAVTAELAARSMELALVTNDPDILARAWYDLGRTKSASYWDARHPDRLAERIRCYQNALRLARRAEDPRVRIITLYSLATIAANAQNDYLSARAYADEAIALAREVGDASGEMGCETVLSTIYLQQGDVERALFHHSRALALAERIRAYGYPQLLIRSANLLVEAREFDKARAAFGRILTREGGQVKTTIGSVPESVIGLALNSMAVVEAESGNLGEAECLLREAAVHYGAAVGAIASDLASYYMNRGEPAAALRVSLPSLSEPNVYPDDAMRGLIAAGHAYAELGQLELALSFALEAIEIGEEIDSRVAGDEVQRAQASSWMAHAYEAASALLIARSEPVEALLLLERARARVLRDIVEKGRPGATFEADAALDDKQRRLELDLSRLNIEHAKAVAAGDLEVSDALASQLRNARSAHASFVDGQRVRAERTRTARRRLDSKELLEMAGRLPPRTVAIAYLVADRELHTFVVHKGRSGAARITSRTAKVGSKALDQRVHEFVDKLSRRDLRVTGAARDLYDLLVAPIERELADGVNLIVVPDKTLWRVPFSALVDGRGRYLVERFSVVYAPSIAYYVAAAEAGRERHLAAPSLFAVGNPGLGAGMHLANSFYRGATLGPLPDAESEVDAIGALYDPGSSVVLKRDEATESRSKVAMRDATVIHFATHAVFDDANPMYSRLALATDGNGDDGWLESWEIARLDLRADIVVLSACETARGRVGGGEGVVGMAWSFFLAGAHSTVATQWKVASNATSDFMIAFHRALRRPVRDGNFGKASALREAQLRFIRDEATRHPFYWAGFVLLGDGSV